MIDPNPEFDASDVASTRARRPRTMQRVARTTLNQMLAGARDRLQRLDPAAAHDAVADGATLIDIRAQSQIARDGTIPGALLIQRNVLEWRLDPSSDVRHERAPGLEDHVILFCDAGWASSLAAVTLQELGFSRATDLDGGYQEWRRAGLPVVRATGADPSDRGAIARDDAAEA